ncbi:hypothetical protein [Methanimicrococcus hongohii]|uniref:hypothetical protein n=1 Tax=Methanimicrococcus hongohii TaxID=3028295 RepID=UPI00292DFFE4|nr:hypothetical protein [Methanimicrococcus sp. Hf6]
MFVCSWREVFVCSWREVFMKNRCAIFPALPLTAAFPRAIAQFFKKLPKTILVFSK